VLSRFQPLRDAANSGAFPAAKLWDVSIRLRRAEREG
jgi:hypothetical protein